MPKKRAFGDLTGPSTLESNKIIVGVDYGTTFTGGGLSDIKLITTWPGPSRNTDTVIKTPSRIAYPVENPGLSHEMWGYQVQPGMAACSWTKLLLDQGRPFTKYDDVTLETASQTGILRLPDGKLAIEVIADYLSHIREHIFTTIAKHITEDELRITPLEFWFTVPAIWSDKARSDTRLVAQKAGFGASVTRPNDRIFLINEPEAAAVTALQKYTINPLGASIKANGVLICDCGGGTVDITTYLVDETSPALKFKEICTGTGGKCGSTAVDRNFYNLMLERFGRDFETLPMKRKGPGSEFMNKFDIIKRDFTDPEDAEILELPLNMTMSKLKLDPEYFDGDERQVLVTSGDLRRIFTPVVDKIMRLVEQQITDASRETNKDIINRIILVGGFGDSHYLRKAFRSRFEPRHITVTIPDNPQAAIVQGAALRGLDGIQPTSKRCRRHYGFSCSIRFRDGIDNEAHAFIDIYDGVKRTGGIISWVMAKGDQYSEGHTIRKPLKWSHSVFESLVRPVKLYACDQAIAPERVDHNGSFDKGPDVYEVGTISLDFSDMDLNLFKPKLREGRRVFKLKYSLKVIFGALEGVLKFESVSQGKVIGRTSIDFDTVRYY
ncbi:actin-like ATPase domain-containing protein [Aspergillus steynii IBT 23096]|uniref:Actin-like ATPase domain-containing protein n=1 Tax=Aspergillus steynii IBT 23096 TaxID=1392250 RepID=A0A2I2G6K6_9EURO|nr:actin-like ATPase domain-containing protein [Aspergillus steynii IBT 23096]PLB48506.1 actin-like ATPase domain-containing protein [Aspergillus steynii IBT 23096]